MGTQGFGPRSVEGRCRIPQKLQCILCMKRIQNAALARKWWRNAPRSEGEPIRNTPAAAGAFNNRSSPPNGAEPEADQKLYTNVVGRGPAGIRAEKHTL